jgi:hypothetical protein
MPNDLYLLRRQSIHGKLVTVISGLIGEIDEIARGAGEDLDYGALIPGLDAVFGHRVANAHDVEQLRRVPLAVGRARLPRGRRPW